MATIVCTNPATGEVIRELQSTPVEDLPKIFERARTVQVKWAATPVRRRAKAMLQLRETLLNHVDDLAALISQENGKPLFEAMSNEIFPAIDTLTYFANHSARILRNERIPMTLLFHRTSYINYWPVGVCAIISPWNYPFLLPFSEIIMAVVAGNAVVFKPSEVTPLIGLRIQELFEEAGLPPGLVQTVIGDGGVGAAVIQQKPNKIFFTGSVATGKKIMAAAAQELIPVNLELGGKDAMIVLPDADIDFATSAALWGAFSNSGQVCASVERILVHESIKKRFLDELRRKIGTLRQGSAQDGQVLELGFTTFEKQKDVYARHLQQAKDAGAEFVTGGEFGPDRRYLQPTVVTGANIESLDIYNEETFGPVVAVSTFRSVAEAVEKANHSPYGLLASVITKNVSLGEEIARQLEVGTVTVNEVTYTAGIGETPWGGVKNSGIGRSHADIGLKEFVHVRHIHKPRARIFTHKGLWWFPYTPTQYALFRQFLELYRRSWFDKIRAVPHVLWKFVNYLKNDKRV